MAYPPTVDTFRAVENMPGVDYDADILTTIFAEDYIAHSDAIINIEGYLNDVAADLDGVVSTDIPALQRVQELIYKAVKSIPYTIPGTFPSGFTVTVPFGAVTPPGRPFVQMTGGRIGITISGTTVFYAVLVNVQYLSDGSYQCFLTYKNEGSNALSSSLGLPPGATVSGDPTVNVLFDYNANSFAP